MRAKEFITEETVVDIQLRHLVEQLSVSDAQILFESSDNAKEITDFIALANVHNSLSDDDIGKTFYPVNLIVIPEPEFISIARFTDDAALIAIDSNRYKFRCGSSKRTFPEREENSLIYRLIFPSKAEYESFELLLKLKFSQWRIVDEIL